MPNRVTIDEKLCKGCGVCVAACPKQVLFLNREKFNAKGYNPSCMGKIDDCTACCVCGLVCPDCAIKVEKE
ncbi:MAG: 4Fe-4S binding protein [Oscillospiraceae bacterium]|nr:4Fe-4S binding protein [Oscillospiraceae bacterium]